MPLHYQALPTDVARAYQSAQPDANGLPAQTRTSATADGLCRHCLQPVPAGAEYLVLAHRPFPEPQPYAEVGPIFVHAESCERYAAADELPPALHRWPDYLLKAYSGDEQIVYGTGQIVPSQDIPRVAEGLLEREDIEYVDVRSARNNCFQLRISNR